MTQTSWRPAAILSVTVLIAISPTSCSSSSGGGAADSGPVAYDSAVVDVGTVADSGAGDASKPMDGTTTDGTATEDAAPICPPASTSSFMASSYVAATAHQGVCSTADVAAFLSACVTAPQSTFETSCDAWSAANLPSEAGAGTPCGLCILPQNTNDNGGLWLDPFGNFWPNYGACVQLTDPVHGAACAAAYNNAAGCADVACENSCNMGGPVCQTTAGCNTCQEAANEHGCNTYAVAATSACATDNADGGALNTCSPGAAIGSQAPDFSYIITLICGGSAAPDGGTD